MIDHTGLSVSDFKKAKEFYSKALAPLGYQLLVDVTADQSGTTEFAGFGAPPKADFWIGPGTPSRPPLHVAFVAESRKQVQEFYDAALRAGGKDNGAPGLRPHYHKDYYGAFIRDLDGNNIEAVCRTPE